MGHKEKMDYFLLVCLILINASIWPVNRWVLRNGGRSVPLGLCISFSGVLTSLILAAVLKYKIFSPVASGLGVVTGIALSVGFCVVILRCLKIGPAGPTTVMNNLGALWPIIIEMVFFSDRKMPLLFYFGLLITFLSMILLSVNKDPDSEISREWVILIIIGWLFSGASMSSQFLSTRYAPGDFFAFTISCYFVATMILLVIQLVNRNALPKKKEIIAGAYTGTISSISIPITYYLLNKISASVIYPVTIVAPAVLILLISFLFLKEKLGMKGWTASLMGITGILVLTIIK
ncbi:MAG: hypothetical protein FIA99_12775 [Ruminiclostridium sp.]|nr:hypothetical protein [Ruminiclostridium sp.]